MSNKFVGKRRYGKIEDSPGSGFKRNNANKKVGGITKRRYIRSPGVWSFVLFLLLRLGPPYNIPEELLKKGRQTLDQVQQEMSKDTSPCGSDKPQGHGSHTGKKCNDTRPLKSPLIISIWIIKAQQQ